MILLFKKAFIFLLIIPLVLLCVYACQSMNGQGKKAYIKVSDQALDSNVLIIDEVYSPGPGWVVIHQELNGQPGPMLSFAKVTAGLNNQIKVNINPEQATITLYASLHTDEGMKDTLEFPGDDVPVVVNGQAVMAAFQIK